MGRKIRVCVADDDTALAEVISEGLQATGFDAIPASGGKQALDIISKGHPGIAVVDIGLPDMDGYEVCKRIKADPKSADTTVIFVTGRGEPEDHEQGFGLGAVDYVTKPFNLPMLMVRVEAAMRMKTSQGLETLDTDTSMDSVYTDQLTGLRNRRFLMERLQEEVDKAHRYDYPVSCVVLDVDGMQPLDETAGPVSVEDLLAEVAMSLRSYTRSFDVLARYDGTLFAVLLPHTQLDNAVQYGEKIMNDVEATVFSDPNFPTKASMSVGVVTFQNGAATAADLIFGEAMRTLLNAKSQPKKHRLAARQLEKAH